MTNSSTTTSKVFLITGCSTGLGLSLANAVLKFGHQVIATSRNPVGTPSAVKSVEAQGGTWLPLDVTSSALEDQFKVAFDVHGRIDVLVNNAGIAVAGAVEDFPADGYMAMFETNFFGPVKLTKLLVPYLREQRGGTIVNISSASTWSGQPALAFYASSKASLNAFSEGLATELAPFGINVLTVVPGDMRTPFTDPTRYSSRLIPRSNAYQGTAVDMLIDFLKKMSGKQPIDPDKAAERIVEIVLGKQLPEVTSGKIRTRIPIGVSSGKMMEQRVEQWGHELVETKAVWESCEFDEK